MIETTPPKLYKYQSCNQFTFGNLIKRHLWFSKPNNFNDPFDCDINFEIVDITSENLRALYEHMRESVKDQDKRAFDEEFLELGHTNKKFTDYTVKLALMGIEEYKKKWAQTGVACFSEKNDDILMWSHYANGHQGFCLEFDTTLPPFIETEKETSIKVRYSNSYPPLSLTDILNRNLPPLPKNLLGTKSLHWCYEAEWRVLSFIGNIEYPYREVALTGVYFRCKMKESDKETIAAILADSPTRRYQMQRSNDGFKVLPNEIFSK
jgi:hypothetical protein